MIEPLTLKVAEAIIGTFSETTKMPWLSWSVPASACITGSKLRAQGKHTVCGSCYALKGRYSFPTVQVALERRLKAFDTPRFVEAFSFALNEKAKRTSKPPFFRFFDSGDLPSTAHLEKIVEIARACPTIHFWLPTREYEFVKTFLNEGGVIPSNLVIRMSVPLVGAKPNVQPMGLPFSTVGRDADPDIHHCPASKQGNSCGDCRACWTLTNIDYPLH